MLLSFTVGGFCSYNTPQTLDLTAPAGARLKGTQYEENFAVIGTHRVMKSALLFGANASGKTNLISGLKLCTGIIHNGLNLIGEGRKEFIQEILRNKNSDSIEFEISILGTDKELYTYYFKINDEELLEESFKKNNTLIFNFSRNKIQTQKKKILDRSTSLEGLYHTDTLLHKMKDWKITEIEYFRTEIINHFDIIKDSHYNTTGKGITFMVEEQQKEIFLRFSKEIIKILQMLDSSISNIEYEFYEEKNNIKWYQAYLVRNDSSFSLVMESNGIKKIIEIIHCFLFLQQGKTVIIDELDSSISTISLIQIFNNIVNNNTNAMGQVIVSTHNPLLFDNAMFHPSQIYLVEKREDLSSELYSLNDFDIRPDRKNLYVDFLKGKFGGVNV